MLWISIDRTLNISLKKQVYEQIRKLILHGELEAGKRLPATRQLASQLGISRNVVIEAYEQLFAEGFIEGQQGSGTFVAQGAFLAQGVKEENLLLFDLQEENEGEKDVIDFRSGIPALDLFPRKDWGRLTKEVCMEAPKSAFGYDHPEGRFELRHVLAGYLRRTRGVVFHPNQLVITSGATQALSLITQLLLSPQDRVIIEDPITHEIQTIFTSTGAVLNPIPVDEHGLRTDLIPSNKKPSFVFVTPSHQFPLGGILPIQRRIQLIEFARSANCYIVEDDYDSEFRYDGEPISSLQGLDPDKVIYIGTFSKILSPALRLGYVILPPSLTEQCKNIKWFHDLHTPSLNQMVLGRFIETGYLEHHISKMRKIYKKRREVLRNCLINQFGQSVKITGDSTGLHLIAEFANIEFTPRIIEQINKQKVKVYPVGLHTIQKKRHLNKIILGYGNLKEEEITEGICRLKCVLN
ncbi:putative transcriptional regulator, GntR family [Alkaliphilus metalliredigens QYMF]|uniref:Putative transcriptional regulator, GntR family n=1 Tax=Alkaliphilus metalliredigens (strain QYMF) TaxID=293826 RepID=A6TNG5_ALKMQ|nr:PLP-dependent aminotransferase family protein [Alkaliphilus metalliredigens]ABR47733.1 putative transcriptional regulator, GntR family [Alkaliphilus metalliredigens QYMF]